MTRLWNSISLKMIWNSGNDLFWRAASCKWPCFGLPSDHSQQTISHLIPIQGLHYISIKKVLSNVATFMIKKKLKGTYIPMLVTRRWTRWASSLLSARSPWSTTTAKSPSTNSFFWAALPRLLVFHAAVKTQRAMLSGPPETPRTTKKVKKNHGHHKTTLGIWNFNLIVVKERIAKHENLLGFDIL